MRDVIFVVNDRFLRDDGVMPYGAAGFVATTARALRRSGLRVALLLYRRPAAGSFGAEVRYGTRWGCPAATVELDILNDRSLLGRQAFAEAVRNLSSDPAAAVYHQSSATVPYTPYGVRTLVTHHAPFVARAAARLGTRGAQQAFDDPEGGKSLALEQMQERGLRWLADHKAAVCVEISSIQVDHLAGNGIAPERCFLVDPPLDLHDDAAPHPLPAAARQWLSLTDRLQLFSVAARDDGFKNLGAVVSTARRLAESGLPVAAYLAAGAPHDPPHTLPGRGARHRPGLWLSIGPRLERASLGTLLRAAAGRAVFVFPSVYETFGLTPLEAMAHGVAVAVPDRPGTVGVARLAPAAFRYDPDGDRLPRQVAELWRWYADGAASGRLARAVRRRVAPEVFVHRFRQIAEAATPLE